MENNIIGFVENSYSKSKEGIYIAHQPIYGYRTPFAAKGHIARYIIIKSILNNVLKYKFTTYIDIGGGEGFLANIIKGKSDATVQISEIDQNACEMAKKLYNISSTTDDIRNLPFADNQFQIVTCSETLEHVDNWEKGLDELIRITSKILIVTVPHDSIESVEYNRKNKIIGSHINHFDVESFNFLKSRKIEFKVEKTLSPYLTKLRIIVESYKKNGNNLGFKIYNSFVPIFYKLFGINSANKIIDLDEKLVRQFGKYNGITLIIYKSKIEKNENFVPIKGENLTAIKVANYKISD
jgi:ubiquinone/menaquinone biosynthesis C-methylase UbiE